MTILKKIKQKIYCFIIKVW